MDLPSTYPGVKRFKDCVSQVEKRQRFTLVAVNLLLWLVLAILIFITMGAIVALWLIGVVINYITSEYNVRKLQAMGITVSPELLPNVHCAYEDACARFGFADRVRIVVVQHGDANALAIRFARQRVVVIFSELLENIVDQPEKLRFLLGHEMCHQALDHGFTRYLILYRPARYKYGRELTCDNAGLVAAGNLNEALQTLRLVTVGPKLCDRLDDDAAVREAQEIESGFIGYFVRNNLTHPPLGRRLSGLHEFAQRHAGRAVGVTV